MMNSHSNTPAGVFAHYTDVPCLLEAFDKSMADSESVGIYYRREAYAETTSMRVATASSQLPQAIMGREVASQGFLQSLLRHGSWSALEVILQAEADRVSLTELCQTTLATASKPRHVHITPIQELNKWLASPTASVVYFPYPPEERFAAARQAQAQHRVAFSGVTHTLCSQAAIEALWKFLHGPWQSYDRLVCTSQAVLEMVRNTTDAMQSYVLEKLGQAPQLGIVLELIPLGVYTHHHHPAPM